MITSVEKILFKICFLFIYPLVMLEAHYNYFAKKTQKGYVGEVKYQHDLWIEYWGYV